MPDDGISIELTGLSELQAKLEALGDKQADAAIRKALRAGADIMRPAIAERAPVKVRGGILPAGALKNDIITSIVRDKYGQLAAIIKPGKLTAHVARWVEYGHRIVLGGRSRVLANGKTHGPGRQKGNVPANPFIRPAYEANREAAAQAIATTLVTEVEAAATRNARNQ